MPLRSPTNVFHPSTAGTMTKINKYIYIYIYIYMSDSVISNKVIHIYMYYSLSISALVVYAFFIAFSSNCQSML